MTTPSRPLSALHPRPLRRGIPRHRRLRHPAGPRARDLPHRHPRRRRHLGRAPSSASRRSGTSSSTRSSAAAAIAVSPSPDPVAATWCSVRCCCPPSSCVTFAVAPRPRPGRERHLGDGRVPARRHRIQPVPGAVHRAPGRAGVRLRRPHPAALGARDGARPSRSCCSVRAGRSCGTLRRIRPSPATWAWRSSPAVLLGVGHDRGASTTAPRVPPLPAAPKPSLASFYAEGVAVLRRSRPFRTLLATFVLQALATGMMLAGAAYVAKWVLRDERGTTFLFLALIAPALICTPVWAVVSKRTGKEWAFGVASILFGLAALSLVLLVWMPGPWLYLPVGARRRRLRGHAGAADGDASRRDLARCRARTAPARRASSAASGRRARPPGWRSARSCSRSVLALTGYQEAVAGQVGASRAPTSIAGIVLSFSIVPGDHDRHEPLDARRAIRCARPTSTRMRPSRARRSRHHDRVRRDRRRDHRPARRRCVPSIRRPTAVGCSATSTTRGWRARRRSRRGPSRRCCPSTASIPTTFRSVGVLESRARRFVRGILHGGDDVVGSVTSGGTESCLLAVKTARDVWRRTHPDAGARAPRGPDDRACGVPEGRPLLRPGARPGAGRAGRHRRGRRRRGRASATTSPSSCVSAPNYPFASLDPVVEVAGRDRRPRHPPARRRVHRRSRAAVLARMRTGAALPAGTSACPGSPA